MAMVRVKRVIFKLLIVLIAALCMDGGRSVLSPVSNIQILITQDHAIDIEIPNHLSYSCFHEEEKWSCSPGIDFSEYSENIVRFPSNLNPMESEFHNSIWQPPETI